MIFILYFTHINCNPNNEQTIGVCTPSYTPTVLIAISRPDPNPENITNPIPNSKIHLQCFVHSVIWMWVHQYQPVNTSWLVRCIPCGNFLIGHLVLLHRRAQRLIWKSGLQKLSSIIFISVQIEADWQFLLYFKGANTTNASKNITVKQTK